MCIHIRIHVWFVCPVLTEWWFRVCACTCLCDHGPRAMCMRVRICVCARVPVHLRMAGAVHRRHCGYLNVCGSGCVANLQRNCSLDATRRFFRVAFACLFVHVPPGAQMRVLCFCVSMWICV